MLTQFKLAQTQKVKNMRHVYNQIRQYGPITKSEVIKKTGLTQTTCTRMINDLLKENLIKENGFATSSGGRKPIKYDVNEKLYFSIGIDLSRTYTKIILLDTRLNIMDTKSLPITKNTIPDDAIQFIHNSMDQMLTDHQITKNQLAGIGVGSVEPFDREKGILIDPLHFPNETWKNVPIVNALKEKWNTLVLLDSGINAAVLAEYQIGFNGTIGNMTYVIAGMGIRTGTMMNHHLLKVRPSQFSKFGDGHMVINPEGRPCICGSKGCLHTYSTIPTLQEEIIKSGKRRSIMNTASEDLHLESIQDALKAGDRVSTEIVEEFGYYTGIGIANMMTLLFSECIVLGGPMFYKLNTFYETVVKTATDRLNVLYPGYEVQFRKGKLGEHATAIGAGSMVFDYYLN